MDEQPADLSESEATERILKILDEFDEALETGERRICLAGQRDTQLLRNSIDEHGSVRLAMTGEIKELPDSALLYLGEIAMALKSASLFTACFREAIQRGIIK